MIILQLAISAWQLKKDDTPYWKKKEEEIASKDVSGWKSADELGKTINLNQSADC